MIGLLFGSQNGLDVSIYDAMEVACTAVGGDGLELNEALVEKQKDLCKQSYFTTPRVGGDAELSWCTLSNRGPLTPGLPPLPFGTNALIFVRRDSVQQYRR